MGPTIIVDKSVIEMLNVDEAVWLDQFFHSVITPVFFVECLSVLAKTGAELEKRDNRNVETLLQNVAAKTPVIGSYSNVMHLDLCVGELLGRPVEMSYRPIVAGGRQINVGGKKGVFHGRPPERVAFDRWQQADFQKLEREIASIWRSQLKERDQSEVRKAFRALGFDGKSITSEAEARDAAIRLVSQPGRSFLLVKLAASLFGLPDDLTRVIAERWKIRKEPFMQFAPYTAHVLIVQLFFYICVACDKISADRPSNIIDVAYYYYLPFCQVFVSNDNLHRKSARLFLTEHQTFVDGTSIKAALANIDRKFSELPESERRKGLFAIASRPPRDDGCIVWQLWKKYMAPLQTRADAAGEQGKHQSKRKVEELLSEIKSMKAAARSAPKSGDRSHPFAYEDADNVTFERLIPAKRGKWWTVPAKEEG